MDYLSLKPEKLTFWYLLILHALSLVVVLMLCFYNIFVVILIPLLIVLQHREWLRYYYLSHDCSVVEISRIRGQEVEIIQRNGELLHMSLISYTRIGEYMVCYLRASQKRSSLAELQYQSETYWLRLYRNLNDAFKRMKSVEARQHRICVIGESSVGKAGYRAMLREFIWGE